jgi:folate-dependent phosphoribosylglycinamide formyltransferase PurN
MAMQVLLISPYGDRIAQCFKVDDTVQWREDYPAYEDGKGFDWIVMYGHRKIVREPWLSYYRNRIINIHISYLPYNKGADPNFWSWFDDTPKGVSIHMVDPGIDTGPLIDRCEVKFNDPAIHTLKTSYEMLHKAVPTFFECVWRSVGTGLLSAKRQSVLSGAHDLGHRSKDKNRWMSMLPLGWDTPVTDVTELGKMNRRGA